jgi:predicted nucleotidyltransferase
MGLDILSQLLNEAERIAPKFRDVRWYAFGSWARGESVYNDIDVLIVYGDGIESQALREELKGLSLSMPLDLYLFHEEEEQEFTFVDGQKCRCIFPP